MKNFVLISFLFIFFSCQKKNFEVDLPDTVPLGKSEIYLNGELQEDYEKRIFHAVDTGEGLSSMGIQFISNLGAGKGYSFAFFGFSDIPPISGRISLHDEFDTSDEFAQPIMSFAIGQSDSTTGEHQAREKYEAILLEEGFLEITNLDVQRKTVEGRFKANFKRVVKQVIYPTGYPKYLEFEGVFHDSLFVF